MCLVAVSSALYPNETEIVSCMAFLVCFKSLINESCWQDKAIYLDYEFYELVFYKPANSHSLLKKLSSLDYNGTLRIEQSQLAELRQELLILSTESSHIQIKSFIEVVEKALQNECSLIIAGDMHPVLI